MALACFSCDTKHIDINDKEAVLKELTGTWEGEKKFVFLFTLHEKYEFSLSGYKRWVAISYEKWEDVPESEGSYELSDVKTDSMGVKFRNIMMVKNDSTKSNFLSFVEGYKLVSEKDDDDEVVYEKTSSDSNGPGHQ
jgi:hypothetical protein